MSGPPRAPAPRRAHPDPTRGGAVPAAALSAFASSFSQSGAAAQNLASAVATTGAPVRKLGSQAEAAADQVRQLRTRATAAGSSVRRTGAAARSAAGRIRSGATRVRTPLAALGALAAGAGLFGSATGLLGSATPQVTKFMTLFGTALTVGSVAMTAINTVMKANPLGFLLGVVAPLGALIIEYALNSETGQRIVQQVFDAALEGFRAVSAFMLPLISGWGETIGNVFAGIRDTTSAVLKAIGGPLGTAFRTAQSTASTASRALTALARAPFAALKGAVRPVLDWLRSKLPGAFTRVRDATTKTLRGMGGFLATGIQTVAGVITGPVKGLIAFANWIIDGLNHLSFSFFGKKFGVHLSKIPMLAEGGIVQPAASPGAAAVRPLAALARLLPAPTPATTGPALFAGRPGVRVYAERPGSSPLTVADDLLFLRASAAA
ncbi:hypothetical protein GA0115251_107029 [Streptomyces sp. TverLS-915]|uniref:hypothetical protein n=1 Tax=Streptomyces sp. TverLS-915 TaxID=1839763 RepID=UPI00081F5BC5|nr:hypothetical protein [Streptomyces sp. TverLS-915]SCD41858.1 hypothetical protein GA0115251_107029 [Streptomyces sp. TverLS-915]